MRILTFYQKLVLRLLSAILWRLIHKNILDAGLYEDLDKKHSDIISETQNEIKYG